MRSKADETLVIEHELFAQGCGCEAAKGREVIESSNHSMLTLKIKIRVEIQQIKTATWRSGTAQVTDPTWQVRFAAGSDCI